MTSHSSKVAGSPASAAPKASSDGLVRPEPPTLAEGFVLLDNSTSLEAVSELFEKPVEIIRADNPDEVEAALAALQAGVARGFAVLQAFSPMS